jgi:geranylgeranyl pyrophosphate synthase
MQQKCSSEEQCRKIIEANGGYIANRANKILLEDPSLKDLHDPLEFISKNWRDPLRPALINLSCESVGGNSNQTNDAALAVSLMNLSFYLWDDLIDDAPSRLFKPTFFGKFGKNATVITGGLVSAKAFTILNQMDTNKTQQHKVITLIWNHWKNMAQAETVSLRARGNNYTSNDKLKKIKAEAAANLEICMKIGAVLGNGSEHEVAHLGQYGKCLAMVIDLRNDFRVTANLTLELRQKIATGALPYSLLWAKEHSPHITKLLSEATEKKQLEPKDIKEIVQTVMETKTPKKIQSLRNSLIKKAEAELDELQTNAATQTLRSLVDAQPQLLEEG